MLVLSNTLYIQAFLSTFILRLSVFAKYNISYFEISSHNLHMTIEGDQKTTQKAADFASK